VQVGTNIDLYVDQKTTQTSGKPKGHAAEIIRRKEALKAMRIQLHQEEEPQVRPHEQVPFRPVIEIEEEHDIGSADERLLFEHEVNDLRLAAQIESKLRAVYPCEVVELHDGVVTVDVEAPLLQECRLVEEFSRVAKRISSIKEVRVHILPESIYGLG